MCGSRPPQDVADQRFADWKTDKDARIEAKRTGLNDAQADTRKAALAAETKVKEARSEAQRQKQAAALAAAAPAPAPAAETETTETAEVSAEDAA